MSVAAAAADAAERVAKSPAGRLTLWAIGGALVGALIGWIVWRKKLAGSLTVERVLSSRAAPLTADQAEALAEKLIPLVPPPEE